MRPKVSPQITANHVNKKSENTAMRPVSSPKMVISYSKMMISY